MKIRNGFVSNSSSSSFLIFGTSFEGKDSAFEDEIEEKAKQVGLEMERGPEGYTLYVGLSWDKVGNDETGSQFKSRVETACKKAFGADTECGTHSEAWYNG